VLVQVCVSALTPLRGGLVRDSMETLSESVSVRERERKVWREIVGQKKRGIDGKMKNQKREREREREMCNS